MLKMGLKWQSIGDLSDYYYYILLEKRENKMVNVLIQNRATKVVAEKEDIFYKCKKRKGF